MFLAGGALLESSACQDSTGFKHRNAETEK